jgi:hypothetical protein
MGIPRKKRGVENGYYKRPRKWTRVVNNSVIYLGNLT